MIKYIILLSALYAVTLFAQDSDENNKNIFDESFDLLSLDDDDIVVRQRKNGDKIPSSELKDISTTMQGYRLQIYTSINRDVAIDAQKTAERTFRNEKVYLVYETPNYKIRVGDCKTRFEAEDLLVIVYQKGYRDAWIVKTLIIKEP